MNQTTNPIYKRLGGVGSERSQGFDSAMPLAFFAFAFAFKYVTYYLTSQGVGVGETQQPLDLLLQRLELSY